jgi:vacuolar-type H+-ATPase subunit F/Vma7
MILWPRKEQWQTWSLPSKLTAIGTLIGIISLSLYGIEKLFHIKDSEKPSIKNSIANTNNSINIQNQGQIQIIQPSTQSNRAEQAPTTVSVPSSTKHVPEKHRMQTLAYDINKFLKDRKKHEKS